MTIPQYFIATGVSHGASATDLIKQTAAPLAKTSAYLFAESPGVGATGLNKIAEEGGRAVILVNFYVSDSPHGNGDKNLCDPIRVCRTAGDIYYRKPAF